MKSTVLYLYYSTYLPTILARPIYFSFRISEEIKYLIIVRFLPENSIFHVQKMKTPAEKIYTHVKNPSNSHCTMTHKFYAIFSFIRHRDSHYFSLEYKLISHSEGCWKIPTWLCAVYAVG